MQELTKKLSDLLDEIRDAITKLNLVQDEAAIAALVEQTQAPDFWGNPQEAALVTQKISALRKHAESWRQLESDAADTLELSRLAEATDEAYIEHIRATYEKLAADFGARQFELMMSGPHDRVDAILEIHAGTGGTDAQDWAQMLERMYLRWAEGRDYAAEILSDSPGEEAGIKSVTIQISGPYAYGRLRGEAGTHRLVRLSPFNSDNLRQTSFALVEVLPVFDKADDLEIDPKDLRVDVYRSSGNGGQSVNTTDSAVRITHLPTGIVVTCQNERSQLQNREKAMAVLRSRLAAMLEEQRVAELSGLRASDRSAAWGQQIRNYVLHPYTKVKDVRTGYETADAQAVLNGAIDPFIEAYLKHNIAK
jgi:peptide chain release factor 2